MQPMPTAAGPNADALADARPALGEAVRVRDGPTAETVVVAEPAVEPMPMTALRAEAEPVAVPAGRPTPMAALNAAEVPTAHPAGLPVVATG